MNKSVPITKEYNHMERIGSVVINEEAQKLLATGEYVLAPSFVKDGDGNRLIELGLIHEDYLLKEEDRV